MKVYNILLMFILLMASCSKMEEIHQQYMDGGEIIYRAKPMDVVGYSGLNRAKLTWNLVCPSHVVRCEVMENGVLLAELPVEYQDTVRMECVLSNLEEKTHTFDIVSWDAEGNSSIGSEVFVEVYGAKYQNTLRTTTTLVSSWRKVGDESMVLVTLSDRASSKIVGTRLFYKNTAGEEKSILADAATTTVTLDDVAIDSYFNLQDLYKPTEDCIDSFAAPIQEYSGADLPMDGARNFSTVYMLDEHTVSGTLTPAVEGTLYTLISYGSHKVELEPGTNTVVLDNVQSTDEIILTTVLKRGDENVEYMAPVQVYPVCDLMVKLDMADWNVIDCSSEQVNDGKAQCAIDGDLLTFWHTQYSPVQPDYPHYIIVDMKENVSIGGIAVARRQGNNNIAARFLLEVSLDGTNWISGGSFSIDNMIDGLQMIKLGSSVMGRYFKLTGESSATNNTYMCIGEINLFH